MDKANFWDRCTAVAWLVILLSAWLSFVASLWLWNFNSGGHFFWLAIFWLVAILFVLAVNSSKRRNSEEQAGYMVDFGREQAKRRNG